jgi:uncharacterized protein
MEAADAPSPLELAQRGRWDDVERSLLEDEALGAACVRTARSPDGRTLLHLAAAAGNTGIVRICIRLGAEVSVADSAGAVASSLAASNGFLDLGADLAAAPVSGLWAWDSTNKHLANCSIFPSSNKWSTATAMRAARARLFSYAGGQAIVRQGGRYYADSWGRALVGWHGTTDPPCGMDGEPLCHVCGVDVKGTWDAPMPH